MSDNHLCKYWGTLSCIDAHIELEVREYRKRLQNELKKIFDNINEKIKNKRKM